MFHSNPSRAGRNLLFALTAMVLTGGAGCTATSHYLHHHGTGGLAEGHQADYFHCGHCGRIVPKHKKHVCSKHRAEKPFFGFQPTCWRPWPAGWIGCPEIVEEIEILEEHPGKPAPEVIPTPPLAPGQHDHVILAPQPTTPESATGSGLAVEPQRSTIDQTSSTQEPLPQAGATRAAAQKPFTVQYAHPPASLFGTASDETDVQRK